MTAPAGGAFNANGTAATGGGSSSYLNSGTTLTITGRTDYTETQNGTASGLLAGGSVLTIQSATLTGNSCGAYGSATVISGMTSQTVADGNCYLLTLTGTDNVNNAATISTVVKVDETAPSASVTAPSASSYNAAGWSGSLTGTATDAATAVSAVKVSIQDTTVGGSSCWNGATFTAACPNYIATAGTTSWSYALASGAFTNGHSYTETVQTTDVAGNVNNSAATATWAYDTSAPSSATLTSNGVYNTAGWPGAITGTVSDSGTGSHGISAVNVSIADSVSGKCWNGTNFTTAACQNWLAVTSGGSAAGAANANWSYNLVSAALTDGHTYTVSVQATDATTSGNQSGTLAAGTFTFDSSAPNSATLTTNGNYNTSGWPGAISGTVSDSGTGSHGISAVNISIADSVSGKCWNGTNFTTAACQNWLAVTSGGSAAGAANANWSYNLVSAALTDGHTYTVSVQATDATTSGNQSGTLAAGTFTFDTSAPSSAALTTNGVYNAAGWPGAISGTVSDSGTGSHGISAVNVSIADSVSGKCWNGTNFTTAACQNWIAVTSGGSAAGAANANWSYTLAAGALTDGHTYTVSVQASDAATNPNQSGTLAAGTFVYDTSAPNSAVLSSNGNYNAAGWPGAITGTVSDSGTGSHGISAVNVSIADSVSGKCWNGTNFTTAACQNWIAVTSGGSAAGASNANWSYTLAAAALTDGHTYTVSVQATDATTSGNQSGTLAAGTFTYDTSAPSSATLTSNASYNAAGWPGAISGTVSDSGTGSHGITAVNVSIADSVSGKCWNGTNFTTAACQNWIAVTSGGSAAGASNANWSYTLAAGALTDGHTYTVSVQATDATTSGNQSGTLAAGTFTYDTSAPNTASLTSNGNYNAAGWPGAITGTTTDSGTGSHGISAVKVSIQDSSSGKCWNGANFTTAACPNYISVTSGGSAAGAANANWSYTLAAGALTSGDTYTVQVQSTDATTSGNTSGNLAAGTFTYDTAAPSSATLTSSGVYNAAGWPGAITGTVSDSGTGSHGISAVNVSIADSVSGKCWNGANFTTAACQNWIAVTSGGSAAGAANANWSYTLAAAALTDGHTYTVSVQATDATTSGNQSGTLAAGTFTYDTSAPSSATLTTNGVYNAAGWPGAITGTVSDSGTGSHGISAVNVSIADSVSGKCWNGTNFTTAACQNWIAVTSGGSAAGAANANWSYTLAAGALTDGHTYTVSVQATDATTSGNQSGTLAAGTFTYDTSAPSTATLTTNGNYNTSGWPGAISGTVSDSGTGSHGISAVNVSIADSVSGKCWNGTNFTTAACQNWIAVTSGGSAAGAANANWSYNLVSAALTDGHTYTVSVQATDATTSGNQSGTLAAGTFTYDTAAPSSATLTTNGVYNATGWPGAITGTVSDSGTGSHGISAVNVSIADSVSGKCWNGANFTTAACQNWIAVTSGGSAAGAANANWSYTLAAGALTDGHTYTVSVQATDATSNGNQSGTLAAGTFTYDTAAPSSATLSTNGVYNAAGWPGAISGTVSDSGTGSHGISAVNLSIADSVSGKCWNGTNFTTAACQNWIAVTSGGSAAGAANANWSYTLAAGALTDGHTYTVSVQATDATTSGNQSGTLAAGTFTYDTSAPSSATLTSNATYNAAGWPGTISGTVSDSGTGSHGISAVNVSIADSVSGKCWNGTNFTTAACQNWIAVTSGGSAAGASNANWSYTLAAGALTDGHTYTVSVQATDATSNGNQSGTLAAGTFTYDTAAPSSATLTTNGNYNAAGWPGAISGTVSDSGTGSHGISAVNVSIADSVSGKCWNGTNFTTAACQNWLAVTSGGSAAGAANANWSYTLAAGALTDGHTYTVSVQATDATTSGNQSGTLAAGTFTYDISAPSSATLTSNGVYNATGWPGAISGTVSDSGTGSHGISAVNVSIADSVSGKCWNGTNFTTAACQNWIAVTSGGSAAGAANANWSYTLAAAALTDGHTYTVSVQATDATTSGNQSGTLAAGTFTYDTSNPTGSITFPANAAHYNASSWSGTISGTATDSGSGGHGIASTQISIQKDGGASSCWDGTNGAGHFGAACPNWVTVTNGTAVNSGTASWTSTLGTAALVDGSSYQTTLRTTDGTTSGNQNSNAATSTFTYDTTAPTLTTAVTNGAGTTLTLNYSEALDTASTPAAGDFTLEYQPVNGGAWTSQSITGVSVSGSAVTLSLATPPNDSQAVRISYTAGTNPIRDLALNNAAALSQQPVTNLTTDTVAPSRTSMSTNAAGTQLTISYDEPLDTGSTPAAGDFVLEYQPANGGSWISESITGVSVSGSTVVLTLATPPNDSQAVRLTYTGGTNKTRDASSSHNNAANFSQQTVTNNTTDTVAPTVAGVTATDGNGAYKAGQTIHVQVNFSEPVVVTGTPQLQLSTGATVNYSSGSSTSTLEFDYTIQAGDTSADLDANATNALTLNGGTIKDGTGNNATRTLVVGAGNAGSLANAKDIVVDTTAPVVHVTTPAADGTFYRAASLPGNLVGDSSDATSVASVQIAIQDGSGNYWDGSDFTQSGITYNAGSGTTSWTYGTGTLAGKLTDGHTYTITAKATDSAGNSSTTTRTFTYDTTPPTAPTGFTFSAPSHAYWPGSGSTVYFQGGGSGGFTVAASGSTDSLSGVAGYTYPGLGSGWSNTGGAYTFNSSAATQTGSVTAQDNAGNNGSGTSFTAQSDSAAPTSSTTCNSIACYGTWYTVSPVAVAITGTDGGSGVKRIVYTTDGSAPTIDGSDTVTNGTAVAGANASLNVSSDGTTTVKWIVEDNVGNLSGASSQVVNLDTSPPSAPTGLAFSGFSHAYYPGSGSTVYFQGGGSGGFTVAASGSSDPDSGLLGYTYPALGTGWSNAAGVYSFNSSAATQTGSVTAKNNALLSSSGTSFTAQSDAAAPTSGITCDSAACSAGWYTTSPVSIAITGSDAGAGVERIVYTTDGSAPTINGSDTVTNGTTVAGANATFNITTLGTTTVKWIVEDNVGNISSVTTQVVKLDTTAPTAPTLSYSGLSHAYYPGSGSTVFFQGGGSGGFTVTGSSADGESGIAGYTYPTFGSGWSNTGGAYTFNSSAATQSGSVTAQNNAGLSSGGTSFTAQSDSAAPTSSTTCNSIACYGTWYTVSPVAVAITGTDGGSGVKRIVYTTDGTDPDHRRQRHRHQRHRSRRRQRQRQRHRAGHHHRQVDRRGQRRQHQQRRLPDRQSRHHRAERADRLQLLVAEPRLLARLRFDGVLPGRRAPAASPSRRAARATASPAWPATPTRAWAAAGRTSAAPTASPTRRARRAATSPRRTTPGSPAAGTSFTAQSDSTAPTGSSPATPSPARPAGTPARPSPSASTAATQEPASSASSTPPTAPPRRSTAATPSPTAPRSTPLRQASTSPISARPPSRGSSRTTSATSATPPPRQSSSTPAPRPHRPASPSPPRPRPTGPAAAPPSTSRPAAPAASPSPPTARPTATPASPATPTPPSAPAGRTQAATTPTTAPPAPRAATSPHKTTPASPAPPPASPPRATARRRPAASAATAPPARPAGTPPARSRWRSPARDAGAGVERIVYTTDGSDPTIDGSDSVTNGTPVAGANASFNITSLGTTTVKWITEDNVGNISSVSTQAVKLDTSAPVRADALVLRLQPRLLPGQRLDRVLPGRRLGRLHGHRERLERRRVRRRRLHLPGARQRLVEHRRRLHASTAPPVHRPGRSPRRTTPDSPAPARLHRAVRRGGADELADLQRLLLPRRLDELVAGQHRHQRVRRRARVSPASSTPPTAATRRRAAPRPR